MVVFMYCSAVEAEESTPIVGNNINGTNDVTARGTDSKIHHVAIREATAATNFAL